jgi:hypothetical protein
MDTIKELTGLSRAEAEVRAIPKEELTKRQRGMQYRALMKIIALKESIISEGGSNGRTED